MYNPVSTYRIQFHCEFNLKDFETIIPYLKEIGIRTIYASPIFESTPGSTHGYDALNPLRINPEIGDENKLVEIIQKLKDHGIGWLQDIVPNHMAFDTRNPWLADVLEKGPRSRYASFFDIDWNSDIHDGKLMVPFLGSTLEQAIKNTELTIACRNNKLGIVYFNNFYPLQLKSYLSVLQASPGLLSDDIRNFESRVRAVEKIESSELYDEEWVISIQIFNSLLNKNLVQSSLELINQNAGLLLEVASQQHYRLVHWQETDNHINYRRFFTINGLICLNIHRPEVFDEFHRYLELLLRKGIFDGLRIDHIDGLYDPISYLSELRKLTGEQTYIIVEKILQKNEQLSLEWPIQGNTGYDFLAIVNNVLSNQDTETEFTVFYDELAGSGKSIPELIREKKSQVLFNHMPGELENLYRLFMPLVEKDSYAAIRIEDIRTTLAEFLIHCPVYRFYGNSLPLSVHERKRVMEVFENVLVTRPDLLSSVNLLKKVLLDRPQASIPDMNERILYFYKRCMQFSGPLMAKGVEDTLMYTYNRFIGHNDVGDSPENFGYSINEFHRLMKERQAKWPMSMNATSTHDTKRGEDVRARLQVLSDLPSEWFEKVREWREINLNRDSEMPDANDEYFIYQTLTGSYPFTESERNIFGERLEEYLEKALRESKRHSNWTVPNSTYEKATKSFAISLLNKKGAFWQSFEPFYQKVADLGIVGSLVQVILKFTCPGIPDTYQGTELWDLGFVDPDNRRPVDYGLRKKILQEIRVGENEEVIERLWETRSDARIKLWLTHRLLQLRAEHQPLFSRGSYIPLKTKGRFKERILAFARVSGDNAIVIIVPKQIASLCFSQYDDVRNLDWKDTKVILPARFSGGYRNLLTGVTGKNGDNEINPAEIFDKVPFFLAETTLAVSQRNAGILMHITSLSSRFGIGDMGPEARRFADFLLLAGQKYWQLLPVNPTEGGQGHSPYSAVSSRAGNSFFISPELLSKQGLLTENELAGYIVETDAQVDYEIAKAVKTEILEKAWETYSTRPEQKMQSSFEHFCEVEKEWLDDFALYMLLKEENDGLPWYEWPDKYKFRQGDALNTLSKEHSNDLSKIKWIQFIFRDQWKELKKYCNSLGILLIGDLPFYVSYDSADVWSHRHLFSLDKTGNRIGVAGVPPDAFSDDGQLWGMPVFNWDALKQEDYSWWLERLKNNRKLFDLIRLDHFRAFSGFWEVPASESTAKNGEWKIGPGPDFFKKIKEGMGELPFIAEDLGDIDEDVLNLRDQFNLPGMKVLQFAFGENYQESDYIPHNYEHNFIVYTGTHDNNTTLGWYRTEADDDVKDRVHKYFGTKVTEDEITSAFSRLAMSSVAKTVILPIQDVLGLNEAARMNKPSIPENNWRWRLLPGQIDKEVQNRLLEWTVIYNRKA